MHSKKQQLLQLVEADLGEDEEDQIEGRGGGGNCDCTSLCKGVKRACARSSHSQHFHRRFKQYKDERSYASV